MKEFQIFYEVVIGGTPTRAKQIVFAERVDLAISKARSVIRLKHNVDSVWMYDCIEKKKHYEQDAQQPKQIQRRH